MANLRFAVWFSREYAGETQVGPVSDNLQGYYHGLGIITL